MSYCEEPRTAYHLTEVLNRNGKAVVVFSRPNSDIKFDIISLPCRKCASCKFQYAKSWAIRCYHESTYYRFNCFLTLTFDQEFVDPNLELNKNDFTLFMKRLRKFVNNYEYCEVKGIYVPRSVPLNKRSKEAKFAESVRYFHAGEYGSKGGRPHHHVCIFNFDFRDKKCTGMSNGNPLYKSPTLDWLWALPRDKGKYPEVKKVRGYCFIGEVTYSSACYVAGYLAKKIDSRADEYKHQPEYVTMSRGGKGIDGTNLGGIGSRWIEKYYKDCYPSDRMHVKDGMYMKIPRFYDKKLDKLDPEEYGIVKERRIRLAKENPQGVNEVQYKRRTRKILTEKALAKKIRSYEDE